MAQKENEKLEAEMAQRLNDLFAESGEDAQTSDSPEVALSDDSGSSIASDVFQEPVNEPASSVGVDPKADQGGVMSDQNAVRELKATILSMDWEITDEVMARLIEQIQQVKAEYSEDRSIFLMLKVLGSVGNYIKTNKGRAHPNAINLIKSTYSGIERLTQETGLDEAQRKRIVVSEVRNFKALKAQIEQSTPVGAAFSAAAPVGGAVAAGGIDDGQVETIRSIVGDIVRQELAIFKRELLAELNRG